MYAEFLALQFKSPKICEKLLKWRPVTSQIRKRTMGHTPQQSLPVKLLMLIQICDICDTLGSIGLTFKFAFLAGSFRFSMGVQYRPRNASEFDRRRHTCRGDVLFGPPLILTLLEWTKTARSFADHHVVPLPTIENRTICPVRAYKDMVHATPTRFQNDPSSSGSRSGEIIVITSGLLRRGYSAIYLLLWVNPRGFTAFILCMNSKLTPNLI